MTALCRAVTLFLVLKLTSLVVNVVRFPVLHQRAVHDAEPGTVSLLVPMRNEASMLHRSLPPLLQQDVLELIILDDQSTDGSAQLAQSLMTSYPHARVVAGAPAPPGWVGKSWACHQLSELAAGSLLVFCDADVLLAAGAVEAAKAEMTAQHAAVFSVFPRQITGTWGERLIIPLTTTCCCACCPSVCSPLMCLRRPRPTARCSHSPAVPTRSCGGLPPCASTSGWRTS